MEVERDDSSSDKGVGAGSKYKKKCSAPSSSSSSKKSVSKSSQKALTKTDENWPKDIPSDCEFCLMDCGDKLRAAMHQGQFHICWAIAHARCIEAWIHIKYGIVVHLSPQHLVNNIRNKCKKTGEVHKYNEIREFLVTNGLVLEETCPFSGEITANCPKSCQKSAGTTYKIKSLKYMKSKEVNEEELIKIVSKGPILAVVDAFESFNAYKDGIYKGQRNQADTWYGRHVILVRGFDTTLDGVNYWKIQNSWGTEWGQNGNGMMIRKSSQEGNKPSLFLKVIQLEVRSKEGCQWSLIVWTVVSPCFCLQCM
ncbi:unnamed protein product [Eruca vesicaria subsp. sativa]|uniref:Peptidase C1A papain C-terminal domain-containing protein n=1 Tax=Eruca vesicaria subsp. sativa TaxID=29727 RepID=A0ABC8JJ93_ERUVS|nr:unnamed protein product [Eruca vesicaria subsp. sativa]